MIGIEVIVIYLRPFEHPVAATICLFDSPADSLPQAKAFKSWAYLKN
jgi:hypothetical protein